MRKQAYPKTFLKISGLSLHWYQCIHLPWCNSLWCVREFIQPCSTFIFVIERNTTTNILQHLLNGTSHVVNGHLQNFRFRSAQSFLFLQKCIPLNWYISLINHFTQSCLNGKCISKYWKDVDGNITHAQIL